MSINSFKNCWVKEIWIQPIIHSKVWIWIFCQIWGAPLYQLLIDSYYYYYPWNMVSFSFTLSQIHTYIHNYFVTQRYNSMKHNVILLTPFYYHICQLVAGETILPGHPLCCSPSPQWVSLQAFLLGDVLFLQANHPTAG